MEAVECGAAALSIILSHLGASCRWRKARVVRGSRDGQQSEQYSESRQGTWFGGARFTKEVADGRTLPMPVIVF